MVERKESVSNATSGGGLRKRQRQHGATKVTAAEKGDGKATAGRARRVRATNDATGGSAPVASKTSKRPKASTGSTGGVSGSTGSKPRAAARSKQPNLKKDLRDFASARPQGWNHQDWLEFLENLEARGHNISDRELIGSALEKERLLLVLAGIKGIGPQKRQALAEHYGNIWHLRDADLDEIVRVGNVLRKDAERIKAELP